MMFEDRSPSVFAAIVTLATVAVIVFPLRVHVRLSRSAFGYDDWCMAAAMVPFIALTIACVGGSFNGVGIHQSKLNQKERETALLWFFLFEILFCIAIILIKLSISFMLARIAAPVRAYVYAIWVMSAVVTLMNLISLFYIVFRCKPVSYFWNSSIKGGSCEPSQGLANIYYADTAVNIAGDWFCAVLPIPLLWNIQMNRNSKIASGFLLSLGVLASLSACIRLKYTVNLNNSDDFLYGIGDVMIWGYAENAVGVIVGCISCLRPLVHRMFGLGGSLNSEKSYSAQRTKSRPKEQSTFEMGTTPARADKARTFATVNGGSWNEATQSRSESEEELVGGWAAGIQVSRSVEQHNEYDMAALAR